MTDPCLRCVLPDCDDESPRCLVRALHKQYEHKRRRGDAGSATEEERAAMNIKFQFWHMERMAQASEGIRPYRRRGSPWTGNEGRT